MKKNEDQRGQIINPNGDFAIVQNYLTQLRAERKITSDAGMLYVFYNSINGFDKIIPGYNWLVLNTGISKGNITKCNRLLEEYGLITKKDFGKNKAYQIFITPGHKLPRRVLKPKDKKEDECNCTEPCEDCSCKEQSVHEVNRAVHGVNSGDEKCSPSEPIKIDINKDIYYTNNTTTGENIELEPIEFKFIRKFTNHWKKQYRSNYIKKDFDKVKLIDNIKEAIKYIPTLWKLDHEDKWISSSDHSISVFIKEYMSGKLQAFYPKTSESYKDN